MIPETIPAVVNSLNPPLNHAQVLHNFRVCCETGNMDPDTIRHGFELLVSLFTQPEQCKHLQKSLSDPLFTCLFEKFRCWQNEYPAFSFYDIFLDWKTGHFTLSQLYLICFIGQCFCVHSQIYEILRQKPLSNEAEDLLHLLELTSEISIDTLLPMSRVIDLQKYFDSNKDHIQSALESTTSNHPSTNDFAKAQTILNVLSLLQIFQVKSRLRLNNLPIPNIGLLSAWADFLKNRSLPVSEEVEFVASETASLNWMETSRKVACVANTIRLGTQFAEEDKFTKSEMKGVLYLERVFNHLPDVETQIIPPLKAVRETIIPASLPHAAEPVTVAVQNEYARVCDEYSQSNSLVKKIVNFIHRLFVYFFSPYGHTFFIRYHSDDKLLYAHGKKSRDRTYCRPYQLPSRYIEQHRINTALLAPDHFSEQQKREFGRNFTTRLEELITVQRSHQPLGYRVYELFLPSFSTTRPDEIKLTDGKQRRMSCAQYVAEAIIESHVKTCEEFGVDAPSTLEFYGFKKTQNITRLRPEQLVTAMTSKGIFQAKLKPYLSAR